MEYKIGRKVRIVDNKHGHKFYIGQIVTITGSFNHSRFRTVYIAQALDNPYSRWNVTDDEIRLVKLSFSEMIKY